MLRRMLGEAPGHDTASTERSRGNRKDVPVAMGTTFRIARVQGSMPTTSP